MSIKINYGKDILHAARTAVAKEIIWRESYHDFKDKKSFENRCIAHDLIEM